MRSFFSVACVLCVFGAVSRAAPAATLLESENGIISPVNDQALISKTVSALIPRDKTQLRSRRSIEMLRRLCPELFQVIDMVVQNLTGTIFRVVGGALLRNGGLGGGGRDAGSSSVNVVLPTFPPDDDDYEDEEDEEAENKIDSGDTDKSSSTTTSSMRTTLNDDSGSSSSSLNEESELNRQIRTAREAQDQDAAASSKNEAPAPENDLSNVETDDADRDKRYSPFGGDGHGSGNFLFDLVRNGADRVARAAGTVYRMVAGTENLGFGLAPNGASLVPAVAVPVSVPQLVTGSGSQDHSDAGAGGVAEIDVAPRSEHSEGIPGPITRLLVVANRGIANLIQDLILRLAQTSERIVNFKARLITALI